MESNRECEMQKTPSSEFQWSYSRFCAYWHCGLGAKKLGGPAAGSLARSLELNDNARAVVQGNVLSYTAEATTTPIGAPPPVKTASGTMEVSRGRPLTLTPTTVLWQKAIRVSVWVFVQPKSQGTNLSRDADPKGGGTVPRACALRGRAAPICWRSRTVSCPACPALQPRRVRDEPLS